MAVNDDEKRTKAEVDADMVKTIWLLSEGLGITVEDAAAIWLKVSTALVGALKVKDKAH